MVGQPCRWNRWIGHGSQRFGAEVWRPFWLSPGYTRVLFDGQSLNYSPPQVNGENTYPKQAMAGLDVSWETVAVSGISWTGLLTTDQTRLHPRMQVPKTILVLNGGQTDLGTDGDSGATALADLESYVAAARAAALGEVHVIACTIPPGNMMTAGEETQRQAYNAGILTSDAFDAVADVGAIAQLQDYSNLTYFYDGLHWTAAGAALAAAVVKPLIEAALV